MNAYCQTIFPAQFASLTANVQGDSLIKKGPQVPVLQLQVPSGLKVERSLPLTLAPMRDSVPHVPRRIKKVVVNTLPDSAYRAQMLANPPVYASATSSSQVSWQLPLVKEEMGRWSFGTKADNKPLNIQPVQVAGGYPDWTILLWFAALTSLLWLKKSFGRYYTQVLLSFTDFNLSMNLFKDRNFLLQRVSNLLQLNFILVLSLFLYLLVPFIPQADKAFDFRTWLMALSVPIALILLRNIINRGLGYLFNREKVFQLYNFFVLMNYKALGIILLPLSVFILYFNILSSKTLVIISIILIIILYLHRIYRGYKIIVQHHISLFYTILYLCTFEFLPLILIYKAYRSISG